MSTTDQEHRPDADHLARVRAAVADGADRFVERLTEWLRIPSISGDPAHHPDVRRSAEHLVEALRAAGFPTAEVWETSGLPAVFAHWPSDDPDAPDGRRLRPPRRPAGDAARALARPTRSSRWSTATARRPRRGRRQGPGVLPPAGPRRAPRGHRPLAGGQPEAPRRGRGGVGIAALRRAAPDAPRGARVRRRRRVGHRHVVARHPDGVRPACAA